MRPPVQLSIATVVACACLLASGATAPAAAQGVNRLQERVTGELDRLRRLGDRLRERRAEIESAPSSATRGVLLEDQATDLTEYESLLLETGETDDSERQRECAKEQEQRQRELETRRRELDRARMALAEAQNENEERNARARLEMQREHLRRELTKTREILARVCREQPAGPPEDFIPSGAGDDPGLGHHFRKGPPPWAGDPNHPDHPRNREGGRPAWAGNPDHPDHPRNREGGRPEWADDPDHPDHPRNRGGRGKRGGGGR